MIIRFAYIKKEENVSDVFKKALSNEKFHYLMKRWLFRVPETNKSGGLQFDHLGNVEN
jgi:hypothetical protein